jgi:hypothetical protein
MFPTDRWDLPPTLGWEISPQDRAEACFWQFSAIGTLFDYHCSSARKQSGGRKRRVQMSSQSHFTRNLVAIAAALLMSTVAVGAAVGPASANANPVKVSANA